MILNFLAPLVMVACITRGMWSPDGMAQYAITVLFSGVQMLMFIGVYVAWAVTYDLRVALPIDKTLPSLVGSGIAVLLGTNMLFVWGLDSLLTALATRKLQETCEGRVRGNTAP